jgi:hypothetical protein
MMSTQSSRWQARIETGAKSDWDEEDWQPDEVIYVYGETIDKLREAARQYLLQKKPSGFSNRGDQIAARFDYTYVNKNLPSIPERGEWWLYEIRLNTKQKLKLHAFEDPSERFKSFEDAVNHFIEFALIPEKGPDYQSRAIIGDRFQFPFIEKILREAEERSLNDLLRRGWHVIALEYKGELSMTGELMNRKAIFVLGHPESQAATSALNSRYSLQ